MRNPWARRVVLGLILAFPLLISVTASSASSPAGMSGGFSRGVSAGAPVAAVEMVLVGGMVFASRERRRLQMELDAARTRPANIVTLSPSMLSRTKVPVRSSMFSYLRR